ncbi:VOC family protein [Devosia elaeis]|uniref:VOC family protein n=1 Tax=Devosia elaeis TaxID=1770058 RepID=UPI0009EED526|nr:VOC family protein [Devosia elaeis]
MTPRISISLPIDSRRVAHDFYLNALGLRLVGEPDEDGMPEPLQFALGAETRLVLIPAGGFEWVIGANRLAPDGRSECLLTLEVASEDEVHRVFRNCVEAGATAINEPRQKDWGYVAMIADPDGHMWMIAANLG